MHKQLRSQRIETEVAAQTPTMRGERQDKRQDDRATTVGLAVEVHHIVVKIDGLHRVNGSGGMTGLPGGDGIGIGIGTADEQLVTSASLGQDSRYILLVFASVTIAACHALPSQPSSPTRGSQDSKSIA
jgi:hypothetical protein